jgi:hypothetical protein
VAIVIESRQFRSVTELAARPLLPAGMSLPIRPSEFMLLLLQWRICFPLFTLHPIPAVADLLSFIHSSHYSCSGGSALLYSLFTLFLQWRICFTLLTFHPIPAVAELLYFTHSSPYSCNGGSAFLYSLFTLFLHWRIYFLYSLFTLFLQWRICFTLLTLHPIPSVADLFSFIRSSLTPQLV